jgi:heme exporter protein B
MIWKEILNLLRKELMLEWKQKYAFNGLLLYVLCMVVVISLAFTDGIEVDGERFQLNVLQISGSAWNIIFWIILFFVAINAIAKSFVGEREGNLLYLYSVASPLAIIIAKILYNTLLLGAIGVVTFFFYALLGGAEVKSMDIFLVAILLGSYAFSANLTLVSAISAKAENRTTLLAVLSFPLIVPLLINQIDITQQAMEGMRWPDVREALGLSLGVGVALTLVSIVLFPFVWRD